MSTTKTPKAVRYGAWPYDQHAGVMAEALNNQIREAWQQMHSSRRLRDAPQDALTLYFSEHAASERTWLRSLCRIRRAARTGK